MNKFFKNKRVLITGSSGFIGRNLFEKLKKLDADVIGTYFKKKIDGLIYCDLTDYKQVEQLVKGVDYVFMVAARTYGARVLKEEPTAMVRDTITMDANVLEASRIYGVKKVSYISSSTVYQESYNTLSEDDLDWNKNPYHVYMGVGWVKRYIEKLCEFYSQIGLSTCIVRPTNIYGKYDKYEEGKSHFIPAIIKRVLEGQNPLIVWGTGNAVKDLIYIDDFIRDLLKVFINTKKFDVFNICYEKNYTIKEIVQEILNIIDSSIKMEFDISKPDSIPFKSVTRAKLDSLYGRESYTSLNEGLTKVIEWMRKEIR